MGDETYQTIDSENFKTFYPRDNNDNIVNFLLTEDPNLALDLTSLQIGFQVTIPRSQLPENGLATKMFMNMNVELNSQLITSTKSQFVKSYVLQN